MTHLPRTRVEFLAVWTVLLLIAAGCWSKGAGGEGSVQNAAEAEAYKNKIEVSNIGLAKGENYLGGEVYYVEGSLKNAGHRVIQRVELTFLFKDSLNQVVLRDSRKSVDYKRGGGLEPDKSTRFQVAFDHLPNDWNYVIPEVHVSHVALKE
jgi:hypothetical protein